MTDLTTLTLAMLSPSSTQGKIDPFELKKLSRWHPYRLAWTLQSRILERRAGQRSFKFDESILKEAKYRKSERGLSLDDTAVTQHQLELLQLALTNSENITGDIVEIGSYRGVTTAHLAKKTSKIVYAVDPFIGYGGASEDLNIFKENTQKFKNISHIRLPSGSAAAKFSGNISLLFIDAVHDFSNSWFDFCAWSPMVNMNGFVAMHDVDDFPGVARACQLINNVQNYSLWAYAPNIVIFRKQ